jgi:hypothetical protein
MFVKLSKLDIAVGIAIAIAVSVATNAIIIVLGQVFEHVYIR